MHNDPTFSDSQHSDPTFGASRYSDPTEYHQPAEPIPAAYYNPYETPNPYDRGVLPPPPPPPPPPKQRHTGLRIVSVSLLCVVMILGGVAFGIMMMRGQQQGRKVMSVSKSAPKSAATPIPTAPAVHPASSSANDLYNDFSRNGLGGVHVRSDNNWSCCTYIPEGGALVWTDSTSGYPIDIAIFKNANEANVDARELDSQNFAASVVRSCLLSYDTIVPGSVLSRYMQLMQMYCN